MDIKINIMLAHWMRNIQYNEKIFNEVKTYS